MSRSASYRFLIVVAALLVVLAGCQPAAPAAPTAAPAAPTAAAAAPSAAAAAKSDVLTAAGQAATASGVIVIGCSAPTSGANGDPMGLPLCRTGEYAAKDLNAKGGVTIGGKKYTYKTVACDNKYTAEGGAACAQKLVYEEKAIAIQSNTSAGILAQQPVTEKEKVFTLSGGSTNKDTTPENKYTFQTILSSGEFAGSLYAALHKAYPEVKSVVNINPNDESGRINGELVGKLSESVGIKYLGTEFFERNTNDYYPTLAKVIARNPDALDLGDTVGQGVPLKQARELGFKGRIWGSGVDWLSLIEIAGNQANGFIGSAMIADYRVDGTQMQKDLFKRYTAEFNRMPSTMYFDSGYDSVLFLDAALRKADSLDPDKIAAAVRADDFRHDTISGIKAGPFQGEKTYGIRSITRKPFYIVEIKDGQARLVDQILNDTP